ncbi:MAG: SAM-dependent DNA methyltransferase [Bacteroidales bacterium]|nr:SAM-dependent DNA methyltransferase [Bacteroidales bacterium]
MTKESLLQLFGIDDLRNLPEAVLPVVLSNNTERDALYRQLLELANYDVSYDWFQAVFEGELSERHEKKQDFTPGSVSVLTSRLTGIKDGSAYEPTAGNGSMIIADWWRKAQLHIPFDFYPSKNPVQCWELSLRSVPLLLLNLSIRGIVGTVYHGDVLEQRIIKSYRLVNVQDDCLGFSKVYQL